MQLTRTNNLLTLDAAAEALGIPKVEVIRATLRRELDKVQVVKVWRNSYEQTVTMIHRKALGRFARRRGLRVKEVTRGSH